MRTIADILALLLFAVGLIFIAGGFIIPGEGGWVAIGLGAVMMLAGGLVLRAAGSKICPQCNERIKVAALKCRYCGSVIET